MDLEKEVVFSDRRNEYKCTKMDTFANIATSLVRIESKVDDLSEEMRTMIKLEQQVLTQSKDLERMEKQVEDLRAQNQQLSDRLLDLRSNFENQKQSIGTIERIGWAAATVIAVLIGKYMFGIG